VFDHCTIRVVPHGQTGKRRTTITAQNKRSDSYLSAFVFINSVVTADPAVSTLYLGRPKTPYSTSVWLDTYMAAPVSPEGWIELRPGTTNYLSTASFYEYRSFGAGSGSGREPYSIPLGAMDAQAWEPNAFLSGADGWWPTLIY
jgi:pectin methylesterase-like acyl-CoA thioesterase